MKLSIISNGFSEWGGGIDFIRQMSLYIKLADSENVINKSLILPADDWIHKTKNFLFPLRSIANDLWKMKKPRFRKRFSFSENYFRETFDSYKNDYGLIYAGSTFNSQLRGIKKISPDVILPLLTPPPVDFDIPWVGYIYDFQHKYMPDFFSGEDIQSRDKSFSNMLLRANHLLVNAKSVADDVRKFYPDSAAKIHSIPFSPCPSREWLNQNLDVRQKYGINRPYFIISNQFWRHKDHTTAFNAFARYVEMGGRAMLICTGQTSDMRSPNYFNELMNVIDDLNISKNILILGHIPKNDQISLIKNAIAVVQPTLFEGGPGGGVAYDAISLGIPLIASNIPVNLEIDCGDVTFFSAGNAFDLSDAMKERGLKKYDISKSKLWDNGLLRGKKAGDFILNVAGNAINNS